MASSTQSCVCSKCGVSHKRDHRPESQRFWVAPKSGAAHRKDAILRVVRQACALVDASPSDRQARFGLLVDAVDDYRGRFG